MPTASGSTPAPAPPPAHAPPATPKRLGTTDRWTALLAGERQRAEDTKREIELALLVPVILIALGGAIYFSFWAAP